MNLKFISLFLTIVTASSAHEFRLRNNCPFTVWPGLLGNPGKSTPMNGGFQLNQGEIKSFTVENGWGGRIWPRRDCDGSGRCLSGDCGELKVLNNSWNDFENAEIFI